MVDAEARAGLLLTGPACLQFRNERTAHEAPAHWPGGPGKAGVLDRAGKSLDLSAHISDISGLVLDPDTRATLAHIDPESLPLLEGESRIGACVAHVEKFIGIGLNFADHARETGKEPPEPCE